jgi:AcrR family transcriptional regulator
VSEAPHPTEDTRCIIVRHAVDLFSHYGYAKTNIGDIAKACCMSPGNLYRYFRNKQAIGEEAVREYMAKEEAELSVITADTNTDFETRLRRFYHRGIKSVMDELRSNPKMVELAEMIMQGNSGILAQHVEWKRKQVTALLREGIEAGRIKGDPAAHAFVLYDMTKTFFMPSALTQMDFETVPARVDAMLDLAFAGMRA